LKHEFDLSIQWLGIEIHPETPPQGRPLTDLFRAQDINRMMEHLRVMGTQFGIAFADRPFLSNSHSALLAAEFARDHGKFAEFHSAVFSAYFSQALDIGNREVLAGIAEDIGLDAATMLAAVDGGVSSARLAEAQAEASRLGVTGVPAFFFNNKKSVFGAQPLDVFRKVLRSLQS
jgi:predicted DsbA family dithiol-disulfide isomerase